MAVDEEVATAINNLWLLVAALMVFLLQPGFGLLEAGSVRAKNAQNIMLKNLLDSCAGALIFWAVGFAFANGDGNKFAGNQYFFMVGNEDYIGWFFQYVFAGTASTIVSGAVAERCRIRAYLIYCVFITGFVYPIGTYWVWNSNGFLNGKLMDFAGSGAVHLVGGAAGMAASWNIGPRIGRFVKNEETGKWDVNEIRGHNSVLAALGCFLLWFGFLPFNAGSNLAIASDTDVIVTGRCVIVTVLAAASGAITMLLWGLYYHHAWDINFAMNGLLAGMVATCAGVNVYDTWIGFVVGILGAMGYYLQVHMFERVLRIDDPLNAAAVHMGAGMVGLLCVGFFANDEYVDGDKDMAGVFYGGNGKQLGNQVYGLAVYYAWSFCLSYVLFWGLNSIGWLRVSEEVEHMGMDLHEHGGQAYDFDMGRQDNNVKETNKNDSEGSEGGEGGGDAEANKEKKDEATPLPEQPPNMRKLMKNQPRQTSVPSGMW